MSNNINLIIREPSQRIFKFWAKLDFQNNSKKLFYIKHKFSFFLNPKKNTFTSYTTSLITWRDLLREYLGLGLNGGISHPWMMWLG